MSIGRLRRNLNLDLIARLKANGGRIPRDEGPTIKRVKPIRQARTYRAARRNDVLRGEVPGVWHGSATGRVTHPPVRLNRSLRWKPMKSYAAARAYVEAKVLAGVRP